MGFYLNSKRARSNYKEITETAYFVDKTLLLEELIPIVGDGKGIVSRSGQWIGKSGKYICITRPRRFGKTVMANMIAAYFGKEIDCREIFDKLEIHLCEQYGRHLNRHDVIYITFNEMPNECRTYRQYISRIEKRLLADLTRKFPDACIGEGDSLWDALNNIYELEEEVKFIFVLDEWDYIFHKDFVTASDKEEYLGFLSNEKGQVSIPNKELMDRFEDMLLKESSLGYVYRLARESNRMLEATLRGDTGTMLEILEHAHNTEIPLLSYSNETELTAVVNLVYLVARDRYWIEREDKSGIGYVDFIFYPKDPAADGIILELKVDHTPKEAIRQIKERKYALNFKGKPGEKPRCTGRILAVGIAFDRKDKVHSCRIEILDQEL